MAEIENEIEIPCGINDRIQCTYDGCGAISLVKDLRIQDGQTIRKLNGFCQTKYFHCPFCKDPSAKVFDYGDGELVLVANVQFAGEK